MKTTLMRATECAYALRSLYRLVLLTEKILSIYTGSGGRAKGDQACAIDFEIATSSPGWSVAHRASDKGPVVCRPQKCCSSGQWIVIPERESVTLHSYRSLVRLATRCGSSEGPNCVQSMLHPEGEHSILI